MFRTIAPVEPVNDAMFAAGLSTEVNTGLGRETSPNDSGRDPPDDRGRLFSEL